MRARRDVILVLAGIALTSAGHYFTPPDYLLWHGIFQRLYYLPIVYAAISFGWRGGLASAVVSGLVYLPHILITWAPMPHMAMGQYAEIAMFLAVGTLTGVLADRLNQVYRELQTTFEQVKRADRLSAIGQLASSLAHEIRNPLASIDGAAEVLEAGAEEELRQETLSIIRKECARLNRLLTNLLDFARPRRPERSHVDVAEVLDSVIELVRHSAGNGFRFDRSVAPGLPLLWCDREQLAQVILNLTMNAIQAMPEGGEVALSARMEANALRIEVKDEGQGIAPEVLDKIFDPFFTTKDTGTGLGLSVVHQIVSQHGGTVAAARNADRGMTFSLHLPLSGGRAS